MDKEVILAAKKEIVSKGSQSSLGGQVVLSLLNEIESPHSKDTSMSEVYKRVLLSVRGGVLAAPSSKSDKYVKNIDKALEGLYSETHTGEGIS